MASNYPGSADSFDTIAADKKQSDAVGGRTHRVMHNDLGDAIEAVQTELGANPSGGDATVAARLTAIEAGTNLGTNSVGAAQLADNAVDTAAIADGAVTSAKIADGTIVAADVADSTFAAFGTVGNLLTANQASGTDTLGTTAGFSSWEGATLSSATDVQMVGVRSLALTATGGDAAVATSSIAGGTVEPGKVYTGSAWFHGQTARSAYVTLLFYDAADGIVGNVSSGPVSINEYSWYRGSASGVAPAGTSYVLMVMTIAGAAAGEWAWIDCIGFWEGAGGTWSMPGVPVTHTGIRPNPANTAEVQIWNDATATWITV